MSVVLKGKTAIVTGGGSGVGRATCLALAEKGVNVAVVDLAFDNATKVAEEIVGRGGTALPLKANVMESKEVNAAVEAVVKAFGTVDLLVNCAGVCILNRILDTTESEYDLIIGSSVKGTYLFTKAAYALMQKQGSGHIIHISSQESGWNGVKSLLYGAAKTAQVKMALHTRAEFDFENRLREEAGQPKGAFYIHALCPSGIATPMSEQLGRPKEMHHKLLAPEQVAETLINLFENPEKGHPELKEDAKELPYELDEAGWFEQFPYIIRIWKEVA